MNELIERLAREAGIKSHWKGVLSEHDFIEAFAKAVARECSSTVQFMPVGDIRNVDDLTQEVCNVHAANVIREKFGIVKVNNESESAANR